MEKDERATARTIISGVIAAWFLTFMPAPVGAGAASAEAMDASEATSTVVQDEEPVDFEEPTEFDEDGSGEDDGVEEEALGEIPADEPDDETGAEDPEPEEPPAYPEGTQFHC